MIFLIRQYTYGCYANSVFKKVNKFYVVEYDLHVVYLLNNVHAMRDAGYEIRDARCVICDPRCVCQFHTFVMPRNEASQTLPAFVNRQYRQQVASEMPRSSA
jgi:hypothetical protein